MYLHYYNLKFKPFEISPDPKFLWFGEKHSEAFAALQHGILEKKGFISFTGDVGTGKTTIVNALINSLRKDIIFGRISDPALEELNLFNVTAAVRETRKRFSTKGALLGHLSRFLNNASARDKEVVLIIEGAHRIGQELLEQLRLLSNIEKPEKKLIPLIFVGQNEFNNTLKKNKVLRQQITISYKIEALSDLETEKYIIHRLKVAGSEGRLFSPEAIREVFSFSEGNPRLINIFCDHALLNGYVKKLKIIGTEIIRECAVNFQLADQSDEDPFKVLQALTSTMKDDIASKTRRKPIRRKMTYLAPVVLIVLAGVFGYFYYFGGYNTSATNIKSVLAKVRSLFESSNTETAFQKRNEITKHRGDITQAQVRQFDPGGLKAGEEIQPGQLKTINEELGAALKELKSTKARLTALESELAKQEQANLQSEQKLNELTKALELEKKNRDLLQAELASQDRLAAEVQEKLEISETNVFKLENQIEKSEEEIKALQNELVSLINQQAASESSPMIVETQDGLTPESETFETEDEPPHPTDIIDWIIKKRSE